MTIVFVTGIHGVGKTTCCSVAAGILAFRHMTASQVIKDAKASAISDNKVVTNLDENQNLLIAGMAKFRNSNQPILLDGHVTLLTESGVIPIPINVFRALEIDGLVVVLDAPDEIQLRIEQRGGRGADLEAIRAHQTSELLHAEEVARALNISLEQVNGPEAAALANAIRRVVNR